MSDIEDGNFGGRVIGREGIEEFYPRMWKNVQDKRRLMKMMFTDQKNKSVEGTERKNVEIEARALLSKTAREKKNELVFSMGGRMPGIRKMKKAGKTNRRKERKNGRKPQRSSVKRIWKNECVLG